MFTLGNWIALVVMIVLFGGAGAAFTYIVTYKKSPL